MPIAAIALDFDPILRLGDVTIRWQAMALAAVILVSLVLAVVMALRAGLRADDLLFIVVGATPGAVVGGRLGYVLAHADYYAANPGAIVDPAQGSASLSLAVLGGVATGALVAMLLGAAVGPWLRVAAVPLVLGIGLGKLAMVLAGTGQGVPAALPWATSFTGPGPWGSLAPDIASHPSQVYEAIVALVAAVALSIGLAAGSFRRPAGAALFVGIVAWAAGRFAVSVTWRDAAVVGPVGVEALLTLAVGAASIVVLVVGLRADATRDGSAELERSAVQWPDPSTRPRF